MNKILFIALLCALIPALDAAEKSARVTFKAKRVVGPAKEAQLKEEAHKAIADFDLMGKPHNMTGYEVLVASQSPTQSVAHIYTFWEVMKEIGITDESFIVSMRTGDAIGWLKFLRSKGICLPTPAAPPAPFPLAACMLPKSTDHKN